MRSGIEFSTCKDTLGRTHFRIAPYFRGTDTQKLWMRLVAYCTIVIFALYIISLLGGDDPDIKPSVNLTPWYNQEHYYNQTR